MVYNLAIIGFGVVGQGLAKLLLQEHKTLKEKYGCEYNVVAIADLIKGTTYDPSGLNLESILEKVRLTGKIRTSAHEGMDTLQVIKESNADIIIEASYTDLQTGEPAMIHFKAAFDAGKHVVTTNKGPVALAYHKMKALADEKGVRLKLEGTVMSGTPLLNVGQYGLGSNEISRIRGILNGTCNYILTEMEQGLSYAEALAQAQKLGYAEAKPEGDVEGWDTVAKVVILGNVLMDAHLKVKDVKCQGITQLNEADIAAAKAKGKRWKLIGNVERAGDTVKASVAPELLSVNDPLCHVNGAQNAITLSTEHLGDLSIMGPGAGQNETGYALLSDLLALHQELKHAAEL